MAKAKRGLRGSSPEKAKLHKKSNHEYKNKTNKYKTKTCPKTNKNNLVITRLDLKFIYKVLSSFAIF